MRSSRSLATFSLIAVVLLVAAQPASAQVTPRRVDKTPTSNDIKGFRVVEQAPNELTIEVEYAYTGGFGENVAISAKMATDSTPLRNAAYRAGRISRGTGTTQVRLSVKDLEQSVTTNQLVLAMYIGGSYTFLEEIFPHDKTWSNPATTIQIGRAVALRGLAAPQPLAPPDGSSFSHHPRATTVVWQAVDGAASYTVEVDCMHCCESGKWCSDVSGPWQVVPDLTETNYRFDFPGAQPGRWRVWAVDGAGRAGAKSAWQGFTYTR